MVNQLPCNAGDVDLITSQGTKIPHVSRQLDPRAVTREPVRLNTLIKGIWNNGLNKIEDISSLFFLLHLSLPLPFPLPISLPLPFREIEGSPGQIWRLTNHQGIRISTPLLFAWSSSSHCFLPCGHFIRKDGTQPLYAHHRQLSVFWKESSQSLN